MFCCPRPRSAALSKNVPNARFYKDYRLMTYYYYCNYIFSHVLSMHMRCDVNDEISRTTFHCNNITVVYDSLKSINIRYKSINHDIVYYTPRV